MLSRLLNQDSPSAAQQSNSSDKPTVELIPTDAPSSASDDTMAATAATATATAVHGVEEHRPDLPRPYKCPLCDKAFHRLEHQTRHIRTHTGEKPHACQFPGCTKRFSRSDELTRHSRIHSNPNSRRANKHSIAHHTAAAAAAAIHRGYDSPALQHISRVSVAQLNSPPRVDSASSTPRQMSPSDQASSQSQPPLAQASHLPPLQQHPSSSNQLPFPQMLPPPPRGTHSAPTSGFTSPNVSPPHTYATYSTTPGSYLTRSVNGDISPAVQNGYGSGRHMDINLLATAASQVERETNAASQQSSQHLSLPGRYSYGHNGYTSYPYHTPHPYHHNRMPSLSSYHYSSNPTSQPMSRSHSHEDDDHYYGRPTKKSRPGSPQSTAPPSPEFPHESMSPTPDHTPLATPSHSPRLRPLYYHHGVQLPTLHHLSLHNQQPPPALAPVEPTPDGHQPYVPIAHTGKRISEIMETGDGSQRKLPIPIIPTKDGGYMKLGELPRPSIGLASGPVSARASEAGNDLDERM